MPLGSPGEDFLPLGCLSGDFLPVCPETRRGLALLAVFADRCFTGSPDAACAPALSETNSQRILLFIRFICSDHSPSSFEGEEEKEPEKPS